MVLHILLMLFNIDTGSEKICVDQHRTRQLGLLF